MSVLLNDDKQLVNVKNGCVYAANIAASVGLV